MKTAIVTGASGGIGWTVGQMRRQSPIGGRIINNGSVSAHAPRDGAVTHTTTKHGVTRLTKPKALVADAVFHMADLLLSANVLFQTIMATKVPLGGRG